MVTVSRREWDKTLYPDRSREVSERGVIETAYIPPRCFNVLKDRDETKLVSFSLRKSP